MTKLELLEYLKVINDDDEITIKIKLPYNTVGPMPKVKITGAMVGIDWDNGLILVPENELTHY